MGLISSISEVYTLAEAVPDTGGVYFVTTFSSLLAPYWDPNATGLLIGTLIIGCTSDDMLMYAECRDITVHKSLASCLCRTRGERLPDKSRP